MNMNMNEKGRQTKLLAALAILTMVVCAFAAVMPTDDVSGTTVSTADVKATDIQNGNTIAIDSGADLVEVLTNPNFSAVTVINVTGAEDDSAHYGNYKLIKLDNTRLNGTTNLNLTGKTLNMGQYAMEIDGATITGGTITGEGAPTSVYDTVLSLGTTAKLVDVDIRMSLNETSGFPVYYAIVIDDEATDVSITGGSITGAIKKDATDFGAILSLGGGKYTIKDVDIVGNGTISIKNNDKITLDGMQDVLLNIVDTVTIDGTNSSITLANGSTIAETIIGWTEGNSNAHGKSKYTMNASLTINSATLDIDLGTIVAGDDGNHSVTSPAISVTAGSVALSGGYEDLDLTVGNSANLTAQNVTAKSLVITGNLRVSGTMGTVTTVAIGGTATIFVDAGSGFDISKDTTVSAANGWELVVGAGSNVVLPAANDSSIYEPTTTAANGATVKIGAEYQDLGTTGAYDVTTFADLKTATELGFTNITLTGTSAAISENFTLPEGVVLTIDASNAAATLTVNQGKTFTIASGATVILKDGSGKTASIYVSTGAFMNVGGFIIGPEGTTQGQITNNGTVSFDTSAEVKTDLTGNGTYNLSDAMKTVYIREDVNSNLVFLPQQTVIVESGYNIVISATSTMEVQGTLIVEDKASITVTKGGLLYVHGNTANAIIDGTVTSNGSSIVTSSGTPLAGVTIDITSAQSDDSVIAINGTLQSKACNDELAIDLKKMAAGKGSIELAGKLDVASKSSAQFNGLEVLEGGVLTVKGTIAGGTSIVDAGTVVMNGAVTDASTGIFKVQMEMGGVVDVRSLSGSMTVTDDGMYLSMVRNGDQNVAAYVNTAPSDGIKASWAVPNSITLANIKGAYITEDAPYENVTGQENRVPVNKMYLSGTLMPFDSKNDDASTIGISAGRVIVPDLEAETDLSIGKTNMTVTGTLDIVGYVLAVDNENEDALGASGNGNIVVSAGTVKTYNAIDFAITAVHYEAVESGVTYNYYTTLAKAIDSGATELDALGTLDILEDITLPTGTTLDATTVNVGSSTVQDVTFAIEDDAEFNAGTVTVYGTMDVADTDDVYVSSIISDTETIDGNHAVYTNLANALANAQDGNTVTITKRGTGIVYLSQNATVKEGVTLTIPAGKTLEIKNGVALTVAGTVDNKGVISAYYIGTDGAVAEGTFGTGTGTGTDAQKKAVIDLDGGLIQSTTAMDYEDFSVPGAYYSVSNGKTYIITTIERAAPAIGTADAKLVKTYGSVTGTDATFTGEEYYNATVEVYGDLTMDSLVLKDAVLNVKATEDVVLNGTFGSAEGAVAFENVVAATGSYLADRIVETEDVKTPTLFVSGSFTKDNSPDLKFVDASVTFNGVVKVVSMTINLAGANTGDNNGDVVIAAAADVAFAKNLSNDSMSMTVKNADLYVEGTLTVSNDATLASNENVVNIVLGTLNVASKTDSQSAGTANISTIYVGGQPSDITYNPDRYATGVGGQPSDITYNPDRYATGVGSNAVVEGTITGLSTVYLFPGSTITEKNVENYYSTTFMVGDVELVTVYSKTQIDVDYIYPTALIGNNLLKGWMYVDANGVMQSAGTTVSYGPEYNTEVTIGKYDTVYANVDTEVYILKFHVDAGVDAIYVDGDIVDSKGLVGQGDTQYPVAYVSAGTHTVTVKLSNGYTGVVEMSFDGKTITDGNITLSGNDYPLTTYVVTITNIDATQTETTSGDDGLGLTDYLLIILVILIVVMAIMIALRLMRS